VLLNKYDEPVNSCCLQTSAMKLFLRLDRVLANLTYIGHVCLLVGFELAL
jgi:hypothetical protein